MLTPWLQIKIYAPACLIVGTRGKSLGGIQGLLPGSVSKYCLQNSPVPVVVVRPEESELSFLIHNPPFHHGLRAGDHLRLLRHVV